MVHSKQIVRDCTPAFLIGLLLLVSLRYAGQPGGFFCWRQMVSLVWLIPSVAIAWWAHARRRCVEVDSSRQLANLPAVILLAFLCLALLSSAVRDPWFYFLNWGKEGSVVYHLLRSRLTLLLVLTALLTPCLIFRRAPLAALIALVLAGSAAAAVVRFGQVTHWEALYRDDHSSFLYRFWCFGHAFPCLTPYDPFWNGGRVSTYALSTGVASLGTLFWPLWRFAPVQQIYTPLIALVFLGLVPAVAFISVRLAGGATVAALCGAVLSLAVTQAQFLWLLHFGTVGACFTSALVMPLAAGVYRVLWLDRVEKWNAAMLIAAAVLFATWPLNPVACAPAFALALLAAPRQWTARKARLLLFCAAVAGAVVGLYACALMRHSDQLGLTTQSVAQPPFWSAVSRGWFSLRGLLRQAHPVLVFLGLGGAFLAPRRGIGWFFGALLIVLVLVAGWGECWNRQLQFARIAIPLFFAAVIPAALWLERLLATPGPAWAPLRAGVVALLVMTGWNCARFYGNRGPGRYEVLPPRVRELSAWLAANSEEQSRILFAGPTVHAYGRGHVAFLPVLAGRQMMACDFYHFYPGTTEPEYPPHAFRRGMDGVFAFLELYNVSHVVTYHERWVQRFRGEPDRYEEVFFQQGGHPKYIFRVKRPVSFFLRGQGRVRADINRLLVDLDDPDGEAVLKYNWVDGLAARPPAEIRPVDVGHGLRFIGLQPHGSGQVEIRYRRWL